MAKKTAKKKAKRRNFSHPIYQLKISLWCLDHEIWRRLLVDDITFDELHDLIQWAMGWEGDHLHEFAFEGESSARYRRACELNREPDRSRLSDVVAAGYTEFFYIYDLGDSWTHNIVIETTLPPTPGICYPVCLAGEGACPPDDFGGQYRYGEALDALEAARETGEESDEEEEESDEEEEEFDEEESDFDAEFDPDAFDLDNVNSGLLWYRRWLGRVRGPQIADPAFARGQLVRIKRGVKHWRYADIPLGGWIGRIVRIGWMTPIGYAIHWTEPTLAQIPAVYYKRMERDREKPYRYWVDENQIEPADVETPTDMEQPTELDTRPLSTEYWEDRIRMVFGLTTDDPLPPSNEQTQRRYWEHLHARLTFPFPVDYVGSTSSEAKKPIDAIGFAEPPIDPQEGIICRFRRGKKEFEAPLRRVGTDDPRNEQEINDYFGWLQEIKHYSRKR